MTPAVRAMRAAYDASSNAWARGPERVYTPLADALVARSPVPLAGRTVLDVGAGTGAASRALLAYGARPIGVDVAPAMLRHGRGRPPGVAGDALALPFADGAVSGAVYAFVLNHLHAPEVALREAARVVAPGGVVLASVFAGGGAAPEKACVDEVLAAYGWAPPPWYAALRTCPEHLAACAVAARLVAEITVADVAVGTLRAGDVVAWRLGMPHVAPFVAALPPRRRDELRLAAERALGGDRDVSRRVVLLAARVSG